MPTMIRGASTTANVNTSQHVRDVEPRLRYLNPSATPFTVVLADTGKGPADNFKFEWGEKANAPRWDQVNGTTGTGTSIVVDNSEYFSVGDLVEVPRTGEIMRVTAVTTSTDTLTVVRAVGSTTVVALADNDDLQIIGSAFAEGSAGPNAISHQETVPFNYSQIFKRAVSASRTQQQTKNYFGNDRMNQRKENAKEFKLSLEHSFLFGERNRDTSDTSAPRNYTGGAFYWATSNAKNASGTLTEPEIWDWCQDLFQHTAGSDTRTLFASALVVTVIDLLAGARLQMVPTDRTYGIAVRQWLTSHGTLMIIKHRMFINGANGDGYEDKAIALEMDRLRYRHMQDMELQTNVQANDEDGWRDQYLAEVGLEFANPELHGVLSGVTG